MRRSRHLYVALPVALGMLQGSGCASSPNPSPWDRSGPPGSSGAWSSSPTADRSPEFLVTTQALDRSTHLVALLDFHAPAEREDKGFEELRRRAVALGADAVMHAEFEHGVDGGPSHLSGMAVKYAAPDERPFDVLGAIEIESPPNAEDKGLAQMLARAKKMGADEVRDIQFEHGEDGRPSRLRGTAVIHRGVR